MSDIKLGKLINGPAERDAIHVAVYPCVAIELVSPGEHVCANGAYPRGNQKSVGIVDPFLKTGVEPGQTFWLMLYQKQVTGMRHHWSHPAFPSDDKASNPKLFEAKQFIESFASGLGLSYEGLMEYAHTYILTGAYACDGGRFESVCVPDAFWDHFYTITGKHGSGHFFTCSC